MLFILSWSLRGRLLTLIRLWFQSVWLVSIHILGGIHSPQWAVRPVYRLTNVLSLIVFDLILMKIRIGLSLFLIFDKPVVNFYTFMISISFTNWESFSIISILFNHSLIILDYFQSFSIILNIFQCVSIIFNELQWFTIVSHHFDSFWLIFIYLLLMLKQLQ